MTPAVDYRHYAQECIRGAARAKTEKERKTFLEMAHAWTRVALAASDGAKQFALNESATALNTAEKGR